MANFQNNAITDAGRVLLSHVQMGAVFTPTKIVVGSGYLPTGTTVRTISAVVSPVKELAINKKKRAADGTVTIGGAYSNQDITQDWNFRELGLYAKAVYSDGQEVEEVLYSYGNAGDAAELMPAYSSGQPVERQMDLVVYIGNDSKVNLTIESGIFLTKETADTLYIALEKMGVPGGVATLGSDGKVPAEQLQATGYEQVEDIHAVNECKIVTTYSGTLNTPYKEGLTAAAHGMCIVDSTSDGLYKNLIFIATSSSRQIYMQRCSAGVWFPWVAISYVPAIKNNTIYVGPTGSDTTGRGTAEAPFASLTKALYEIPKDLGGQTITINVAAGTYTESNVGISDFYGGVLKIIGIQSNHPVFTQGITVSNVKAQIIFQYIDSQCTESRAGYVFQSCPDAQLNECVVTGDGTGNGFFSYVLSKVHVYGCSVNNAHIALCCERGNMYVAGAGGTGNKYAAVTGYGGIMTIDQSLPGYTVSAYFTSYGGRIYRDAQANVPKY